MKLAIGCDHAGPELKKEVLAYLDEIGVEYVDLGVQEGEKCDYPDKAQEVCAKVTSGECELAVLICGTGIGMSMAANKVKGIRAACCSDYCSVYRSKSSWCRSCLRTYQGIYRYSFRGRQTSAQS